MTRAIRSLNKGRLRVWWVHHGPEAKRAGLLALLAAIYLLVSELDYRDQVELARLAGAASAQAEAPAGFARPLPRITFVLDARTPEELELRLAEIAGGADGWRAELRGGRP